MIRACGAGRAANVSAAPRGGIHFRLHAVADVVVERTITGFYDHAHFIRTFKSVVGITPSRYRKRHWTGA